MTPTGENVQARRRVAPSSPVRGRVRLRTLSNLRWMAIAGQSLALLLVYFGFGYRLPLVYCAIAIGASAVLNSVLALLYPVSHRLTNREATFYLAFDVLQLAALLYLTGGITNPFALMFVAPVVIAAATLNLGNTLMLAGIAFVSVSLIGVVHRPPQPQLLAGLTKHRRVDAIGHGRNQDVGKLHGLDQLGLSRGLVVEIEPRVEQFAHAGFDRIRQLAGHDHQRFLTAGHVPRPRNFPPMPSVPFSPL